MPYYHCKECHHEFEAYASDGYKVEKDWSISVDNPKCDWCGALSTILEEKTPLEKICTDKNIRKLVKKLVAIKDKK